MDTVSTLTLTDFLLARIAEDEAAARAATPGPWVTRRNLAGVPNLVDMRDVPATFGSLSEGRVVVLHTDEPDAPEVLASNGEHIARHDPGRVLAECEAKRRIVDECLDAQNTLSGVGMEGDWEAAAAWSERWAALEPILSLLALPYADHPDYREEWRP